MALVPHHDHLAHNNPQMQPSISLQNNTARPDWQQCVEDSGLVWHGGGTVPYWVEDQHIEFTLAAAEVLEAAANELHAMCMDACDTIVQKGWYERLFLPENLIPHVEESWREGDPYLYGRFDLAWDGVGSPKLLEYNADTPTSLLEAAVIQWQWLEHHFPEADQLNSLHEALIESWRSFSENQIHFACVWDQLEDRQTIAYLAECAEQAGKIVSLLDMQEIGYVEDGYFTDQNDHRITKLFKLYPWEWLCEESFFEVIGAERKIFLEPAWKMMLSNKAILPLLWELHPQHPLLLPASSSLTEIQLQGVNEWVSKPCFGREGQGITMMNRSTAPKSYMSSTQNYGANIYQEKASLFQSRNQHFIWGLWMVEDECRGLSARGDASPITGNLSRFYPHVIL